MELWRPGESKDVEPDDIPPEVMERIKALPLVMEAGPGDQPQRIKEVVRTWLEAERGGVIAEFEIVYEDGDGDSSADDPDEPGEDNWGDAEF